MHDTVQLLGRPRYSEWREMPNLAAAPPYPPRRSLEDCPLPPWASSTYTNYNENSIKKKKINGIHMKTTRAFYYPQTTTIKVITISTPDCIFSIPGILKLQKQTQFSKKLLLFIYASSMESEMRNAPQQNNNMEGERESSIRYPKYDHTI